MKDLKELISICRWGNRKKKDIKAGKEKVEKAENAKERESAERMVMIDTGLLKDVKAKSDNLVGKLNKSPVAREAGIENASEWGEYEKECNPDFKRGPNGEAPCFSVDECKV